MLPPPPGTLSTITGCPRRSASPLPTCRATASVNPPGGYGTIRWIGRSGYAALWRAKRGYSLMVLERDYYGSHSSGINFGAVRRHGRPLTQLPLAARAGEIWAKLPEIIGTDGGFVRCGHLKLARNEIELS